MTLGSNYDMSSGWLREASYVNRMTSCNVHMSSSQQLSHPDDPISSFVMPSGWPTALIHAYGIRNHSNPGSPLNWPFVREHQYHLVKFLWNQWRIVLQTADIPVSLLENGSFVRGIHWSPVNSPYKGQWRGSLMLSLICPWINGWVSNREPGDWRRHPAHYDVTGIQALEGMIDYIALFYAI